FLLLLPALQHFHSFPTRRSSDLRSSSSLIVSLFDNGTNFLMKCCHWFKIHTIGFKRDIIIFKKGAVAFAKFSGEIFARSFGVISPKSNKRTVVIIVAILAP